MTTEDRIERAFRLGWPIDQAMQRGVRHALWVHKRLGHSIVIWRDGQVVWIPAEEIPEEWVERPPVIDWAAMI